MQIIDYFCSTMKATPFKTSQDRSPTFAEAASEGCTAAIRIVAASSRFRLFMPIPILETAYPPRSATYRM